MDDFQINIPSRPANQNADREALKKQPGSIHRTFNDMKDLEESANSIYAKAGEAHKEMIEKDKAAGLDVNDIESIRNFKIGYTPLGNTLLIKQIHEDLKYGSILLPDGSNNNKKAVVIVPGLYVTTLKKGDIITLKPTTTGRAPYVKRTFKGVEFDEIDYDLVGGIFMEEEDYRTRCNA